MALRKEQVLLLVTAAVGLWLWRSGAGTAPRTVVPTPTKLDYAEQPLPSVPLVTGPRRDGVVTKPWFREPSETQPLPPRELPFPPHEPLFVVALPLDPGPDLSHAELLRVPGTPVQGVALGGTGTPGGEEGSPANGEPAGGTPTTPPANSGGGTPRAPQEGNERWERVYDQVFLEGQSKPFYGIVTATTFDGRPIDRFDLESRDDLSGVLVTLQKFSTERQRIETPALVWGRDDRVKVRKVTLANTLRNEVGRRVRRIPPDGAHHVERRDLVEWLLQRGREEGWVYDVALQQARIMVEQGGGVEALRLQARVLQQQGAVANELALYQAIAETNGPAAAFKHEGLGTLLARLGLAVEAEQELRQAVAAAPLDPVPHAALARFLRQRGRPQEAAAVSKRAIAMLGSVTGADERLRVIGTEVACALGVGDVARARQAVRHLDDANAPETAYLRACIDYTAGELATARDGFRVAASGPDGDAASLGLAACQLRLEQWQEAKQGFEAVAAQAPLQRHRALAGLALLDLRTGNNEAAIAHADEALAADPLYTYALYLKGRAQAEQGMLGQARESLTQALKLRDDFAPAVMEMALVSGRLAADVAGGTDQARFAREGLRYSDRAVALAAVPLVPFLEFQAMLHFAAADLRGSKDAFAAAREATDMEGGRFAQAGQAVVAYAMGRTEDALDGLRVLIEEIQQRDHPIRRWAETTRELIDDHAQKEQLNDQFARATTGNVWAIERQGSLGDRVDGERLHFEGSFPKTADVYALRTNAVPKAGNFLAVAVTMQLGPKHQRQDSFAGLRLESHRGATGAPDFLVELGVRDGRPHVHVKDGREEEVRKDLQVDLQAGGDQRLELRVVPRGPDGRQFTLLASWNGQIVHEQELQQLQRSNQNRLETILFVAGKKDTFVDVFFDDYHLERRKDG